MTIRRSPPMGAFTGQFPVPLFVNPFVNSARCRLRPRTAGALARNGMRKASPHANGGDGPAPSTWCDHSVGARGTPRWKAFDATAVRVAMVAAHRNHRDFVVVLQGRRRGPSDDAQPNAASHSRKSVVARGAWVPGASDAEGKCSPPVVYITTPARPRSHRPA